MTTRIIRDEAEREALILLIQSRPLPFTASLAKGANRSWKQNRLQRLWVGEAAEQLGDHSAEYLRGLCKLQFGVPILRAENEAFREAYDKNVKGLDYETKIALMMEPLDFPVTRLMTSKQKTAYLDEISRSFSQQGVRLTDPDDQGAFITSQAQGRG